MMLERAEILKSHTKKEQIKKQTKEKIKDLVSKGLVELADQKKAKKISQEKLEAQRNTIDGLEDNWGELEDDKEKEEELRKDIQFDTSDEPIEDAEGALESANAQELGIEELDSYEEFGEINTEKKKKKKEKKTKKNKVKKEASVEVTSDYAEEAEWYGFEPNEKDFFKRGEFMDEQNLAKEKMQLEEKSWETIQNIKPQEVINIAENLKYRTDHATMELIDNVTGKKGAGEEYAIENNQLILLDSDIDYIEKELMAQFDFDVNRAGLLKKFNVKRKLDPEAMERFDYLVSTHQKMQKEYNKQIKKHLKKFADVLDIIATRSPNSVRSSIIRLP